MGLVEEKRVEYGLYIEKHQLNVWKAWMDNLNLFITFFLMDGICTRNIQAAIINHDNSKFSDEEFEFYRKKFFPVDEKEKESNKESFDMAWKHHYQNNPHHWNHWVGEDGIAKEMDDENIIHMICDWIGMGMQFGNTAAEFYEKDKEKINLAPNTRIKVESLLAKMR